MTQGGAARGDRTLLLLAAAGVFIAADDQTSIVTVLPAMVGDIGLKADDFYRTSWIVNGYLLGYLAALPVVGRVADLLGHARVFVGALIVFCVGSALVAVAPTFEAAVAARALQAIGGGGVVPVAMAIVVDEVRPDRRALGLGMIAAASEAGALIGPLWGGAIAEWVGWRWMFWSNLPLTVPVLIGIWPLAGRGRRAGRVDVAGAALIVAALTLLTVALVDDPNARRAWPATAALVAAAVAAGAGFVLHERRTAHPMVRLAMLAPREVVAAHAATLVVGGGLIVALIGVPLFVNLVLVESPLDGGLTLMRLTVAVPVGAVAGGWLSDRVGLRLPAVAGMLCATAGFVGLQAWDVPLSPGLRTAPLLVGGLGFGLVIAPLSAAVLRGVPEAERATASSWLTLSRLVGMLVGAALLTSTGLGRFYARASGIDFRSPEFDALVAQAQVATFREVFVAAAVVMALGAAAAAWVGRGGPAHDPERWWTIT